VRTFRRPEVRRRSYGLSGLLTGQRDVLALVAVVLWLLGPDMAAAAENGPRPPCGESVRPEYAGPGARPSVEVWNDEELSGAWVPPACTGWTARDDRLLLALAGSFHHEGGVEDLLSRFGAISTLTDIRYWSVSDKAWLPLVTEATALSAPDAERRRADFGITDLVVGRDLFIAQNDNRSSGTVIYRMRVLEVRPERLVIQTENVTAVRKWLLQLFGPGDIQAVYFLERSSPDVWGYYSLTRTDAGSKLLSGRHEASYVNRAVALYRHFAGIPTDRDPPAAP
jgi:hypothetical protein